MHVLSCYTNFAVYNSQDAIKYASMQISLAKLAKLDIMRFYKNPVERNGKSGKLKISIIMDWQSELRKKYLNIQNSCIQ